LTVNLKPNLVYFSQNYIGTNENTGQRPVRFAREYYSPLALNTMLAIDGNPLLPICVHMDASGLLGRILQNDLFSVEWEIKT